MKSKKNQYKKKSIKKGGMRRRLTDEMLAQYQRPMKMPHPNDCCPCVFKLLGMNLDQVEYFQESYRPGLTAQFLEEGMNQGFPDFDSKVVEFAVPPTRPLKRQLYSDLFGGIPNGYAAIGGIRRNDGGAHCVAFAKDLQGECYVFDAQVGPPYPTVWRGEQQIVDQWEPTINIITILNSYRKPNQYVPGNYPLYSELILDGNGQIQAAGNKRKKKKNQKKTKKKTKKKY